MEELRSRLYQLREKSEQDPYTSPIKLLALDIRQRLADGRISEESLEPLVQRLTVTAARSRAGILRRYLGELGEASNNETIGRLIRGLAFENDSLVPFETFKERLERAYYGFVITAHPTFSLAVDLQRDLMALVEREDDPLAIERLERSAHRPDPLVTLDYEQDRANEAILNLLTAISNCYRIALDVGAELYPEQWRTLSPKLVTLATWVGYDTDGRSDILWSTTFAKRLRMKHIQLLRYRETIQAIVRAAGPTSVLISSLELIEARLSLAIKTAADELQVLDRAAVKPFTKQELARLSKQMIESGTGRLVHARQILELMDRAIAQAEDPGLVRELLVLKAEIKNHGLAAARSHLRINSLQLHNAIRKQIGMDHAADDPSYRLSYLRAITEELNNVRPVQVNFGTVQDERATARRVFMTMAQMLKFIDAGEPIRFLIAECESGFTLLVALYFAKLFGIERLIDISPLFETRNALERGVQIIDEALSVPVYRDYVKGRGRLCLQAGFSDAGRYLGQLAAAVAIERVRLGLAEVLQAKGLDDIEVIFFDTHGESIGRGGHPLSLADRFRYLDSPESRRRFQRANIRLREETSFQGGDGYRYFLSSKTALAVLTRSLEHFLGTPQETDDPFYVDTSYIDEFFATIEQFNARVIADPCYAALLTLFSSNLLYPSGSRSLRRQFDAPGAKQAIDHPSQIRAIPHNSILQQFGILANTIGGLGQAVGKNPERFLELYRESARFRRLMTMVEHAFMFTDLEVVRGYLDLFDPASWLKAAWDAREPVEREQCMSIAALIEHANLHDRVSRIFRIFRRDHLDLAWALRAHRRATRSVGDEPIAVDPETRDNMHLLHATRLALIERIMRLAVQVPDFSDRHPTTRAGLVMAIIQLDIEPALQLLGEVFPLVDGADEAVDFGEPSTYQEGGAHSYAQEHMTIFRPIARDYDLIRRISTALVHHLGALG
ncbi:Phosphoenolpyruvate carboxylase, type 1 [Arboricoccus pini]|uniref:Phosphoenolpyruvate carboxylase n=1 Tax=Arboricoccus pini TaxID=1963835 RepID=A0A212R2Y1_9PROT|nr:Phosphoenolpyruvate carboxylase, type 1 [Arboricoccus pini]